MKSNEIKNQEILGRLVEREVIMDASHLVEDLLELDKLSYDDIENYYYYQCPECGDKLQEVDEDDGTKYYCESDKYKTDEQPDSEPQEVYEWWFISEFLYDKLKKYGKPVINSDYGYLWGRTCTGQAIMMDGVIKKIGSEMEILAGQRYDWSK